MLPRLSYRDSKFKALLSSWCSGAVFFEKLIVTQMVWRFHTLMELDGSAPCLQNFAAGPCHEPGEFRLYS
jgi:hypothetical protein